MKCRRHKARSPVWRPGDWPSALIEEHYRAYQRPGTVIEVHGVKDESGENAQKVAGKVVNYAYLHRMHDAQMTPPSAGLNAFTTGVNSLRHCTQWVNSGAYPR